MLHISDLTTSVIPMRPKAEEESLSNIELICG